MESRHWAFFWLDLEVKARAPLRALDEFLREIWLECCGHLSCFHIEGTRYSSFVDTTFSFGLRDRSMRYPLEEVLGGRGQRFRYEYDFGSTTELTLRVWGHRDGVIGRKPVRLLARNEPPLWLCRICGHPATLVCPYCFYDSDAGSPFFCAEHSSEDDPQHEGAVLPVVNSPRMGVCGYTGEPLDEDATEEPLLG